MPELENVKWSTKWASSKDEENETIVNEAHKRYKACEDWEAVARTNFEFDYKFANGDAHNHYQWDDNLYNSRDGEDRPCLTINKTKVHNLMVINDAKQNKPGVRIRPVGDEATYEAAQIYQELIYHIEYISSAENVYDNATSYQVEGGIGYWRVTTDYVNTKSFDQEIYIRRIKDPRSVYLDPNINEVDGSDASFGFIFDDMQKDLFAAKYPKFKDEIGLTNFGQINGWIGKDTVRVAEYFRKTQNDDKLVTFTTDTHGQIIKKLSELEGTELLIYKELKKNKIIQPTYNFKERKIVTDDIEWFKIAGDKIIEKRIWPGKYIPIVRLVGTETVIDGILDRKGHTRALINAQQIYNYNCLDLNTRLPTPTGWTTIYDVQTGDWLLDDKGLPTQVLGISPININRKCFELTFDSGEKIIADENHLWTVEERGKAIAGGWQWLNKTITTKELVSKKHFIKVVEPISLPNAKLPIHPYMLGIWLGDGSTAANIITSGLEDMHEMQELINSCGYKAGVNRINKTNSASAITVHGLRNDLVNLNLLGNKHIPNIYLRASKEQRQALLQGLMDTDGCINKKNRQCVFTNSDKLLISNVIELISSLGIKCKKETITARSRKFPNGKTYNCQEAYRLTFTADPTQAVFKLKRKLEIQENFSNTHWRRTKRHGLVSIVETSSIPVKCLTVDAPSKLFLAGEHWIPTHNTSANVEYGALQTKAPWLAPTAAIEGFEEYYKTANSVNHSYLPYNHIDDEGNPITAPSRPQPPQPGMAYVEGMKISQNEMMMATGQYQAQLGENENAKSGVAINARQRQGDRATYHFIDNLAIAIRFTGKILLDLIPKVYDTKRVMRITGIDGKIMDVTIDPNAQEGFQKSDDQSVKDKSGEIVHQILFNPNVGEFDVQSDTGPSFATKRMEAAAALTQLLGADKELMKVAGDIYFEMLDFPKADVLAARFKKMIPPNISGDAPDPQTEEMMSKAADHIQMLTGQLADAQKKLEDKEKELQIKEHDLELKFKREGAVQAREDYKAETERLTAAGNAGPGIAVAQIQPIVKQLIIGMLNAGEPGAGDKVAPLLDSINVPEPAAVEAPIEAQEPANEAAGDQWEQEKPPMEGAQKAPDGNWYLPDENRPGKYLQVQQQ